MTHVMPASMLVPAVCTCQGLTIAPEQSQHCCTAEVALLLHALLPDRCIAARETFQEALQLLAGLQGRKVS